MLSENGLEDVMTQQEKLYEQEKLPKGSSFGNEKLRNKKQLEFVRMQSVSGLDNVTRPLRKQMMNGYGNVMKLLGERRRNGLGDVMILLELSIQNLLIDEMSYSGTLEKSG